MHAQLLVVPAGELVGRKSANEIIRIHRRRGNQRQHVAVAHIHDDDRAAHLRAGACAQRALGGLLNPHVQRQHDRLPGLGGGPHAFGLAIAQIIYEHRLPARPAPQLFIKATFDTHHAAIIRQPIGEISFLALGRTVVAAHITQHV